MLSLLMPQGMPAAKAPVRPDADKERKCEPCDSGKWGSDHRSRALALRLDKKR
jgi:hypothetical protein